MSSKNKMIVMDKSGGVKMMVLDESGNFQPSKRQVHNISKRRKYIMACDFVEVHQKRKKNFYSKYWSQENEYKNPKKDIDIGHLRNRTLD